MIQCMDKEGKERKGKERMDEQRQQWETPPHVLVFPFPIQGNVNSMLKLAELLCLAGVHVTFLNCLYSHHRLLSHSTVHARFSRYPGFRFDTIPDGLPMDHPRTSEQFLDIVHGVQTTTRPLFTEMMTSWCHPPLTCIISDELLNFAIGVGKQIGVPVLSFCSISACSFWAYFSTAQLLQAGEVPVTEHDMDRVVSSVPGMEGFLRRRDLPGTFRVNDVTYSYLQHQVNDFLEAQQAHALILNTFDDIEGPVLSQIRKHYPRTYSVGPLHALLKSKLPPGTTSSMSNSFREEDRSCIEWLDRQPPKSVIYVSFGSIVITRKEEVVEFWHGLVNSSSRFLWVIRPDAIVGEVESTAGAEAEVLELEGVIKDKGYVVSWAPQEEVLQHPAVGGFLTHSGWNSTVESIVAGKPMICWPYYCDQQTNSRFVGHVWKVGMDMKDTCDRTTIEEMVRDLMEERSSEFRKAAETLAVSAKKSVSIGGSSYSNFNSLINEITSLTTTIPSFQINN